MQVYSANLNDNSFIIGKFKETLYRKVLPTKKNNDWQTEIVHLKDIDPSERNDHSCKMDFTWIQCKYCMDL